MATNAFISSAGHSGSTLLDMMLGSHPRCESIGELINLPMDMAMNTKCGCGQPMLNCSLWPEVMRRMAIAPEGNPYKLQLGYALPSVGDKALTSTWHKIITRPKNALKYAELRLGLDWLRGMTPGFDIGIDNTLAVYEHVRGVTGKDVVVDSSKHYLRAVELYRKRPESTRVIVLVRDGRGVFYSYLKRKFKRDFALNAWRNHYRRLLILLGKHVDPQHQMTVHYENLIENPRETLEQICTFLGIEYSENMIDFRSVVHHNVNGNDMKYLVTPELRLDVSWKKALAKEDLAYFERHAGGLNRQFGYG